MAHSISSQPRERKRRVGTTHAVASGRRYQAVPDSSMQAATTPPPAPTSLLAAEDEVDPGVQVL